MRVVWKFPLDLRPGPQKLEMPVGAMVVHAFTQVIAGRPSPVMWATVDPTTPTQPRTFHVLATGEEYRLPVSRYVGTVHVDWTVWHIIEDRSA